MNKREFLKAVGMASFAAVLPLGKMIASVSESKLSVGGCVLIPSETAGPFPLDLTENAFYFRQDVREDRTGAQFNLRMKIIGLEDCLPMQNVRVNIWHCSKDGLYSGYDTGINAGQTGLTYLRGYQITDANGEVEFISIFPGWYPGRICHIHFQVHVSSNYSAVSQMTFDLEDKNAIYSTFSDLYTEGADPLDYSQDGVFSDGHAYQLATISANESTGGYDGFIEVTVQGSGTVGVGHLERETAKVVGLGQNFPNPFQDTTVIPFNLKESSFVQIELWNLEGKKVATPVSKTFGSGNQQVEINLASLGLPIANYVYQIEVKNDKGKFRTCKMMTATR